MTQIEIITNKYGYKIKNVDGILYNWRMVISKKDLCIKVLNYLEHIAGKQYKFEDILNIRQDINKLKEMIFND